MAGRFPPIQAGYANIVNMNQGRTRRQQAIVDDAIEQNYVTRQNEATDRALIEDRAKSDAQADRRKTIDRAKLTKANTQ